MESLSVDFKTQGETLHITLDGSLTLMDALELKKILPSKVLRHQKVVVDLKNVNAIDLTGFNALLMTRRTMGKNKVCEIIAPKDHTFHELAHLTKFKELFVFQSES